MLFKLAVSADPDHFAKNHDIFMDKNRTRVFIFFEPSTSDQEIKKILNDHKIMIEKGTSHMIRGLMAVEHLIPLSKENAVRSIRLPNKLIRAREINP